jgi:resuscitation-promoting factor RpfA
MGAVAVLRRRTLKVLERAAILVVAGLFVVTAGLADDSKPRQPSAPATTASAGASSTGDTNAKTAAGSSDSAAATGASDAAAAPVSSSAAAPSSSSSSSSSSSAAPAALPTLNAGAAKGNAAVAADEDSEQPNFTPMPALDGNPGLFTLETGETLPKHGWSLGIGLNKFSRMPGDITSLQLIPSVGYGVNRWFSIFFQINS